MKFKKIILPLITLLLIISCSKDTANPDSENPRIDRSANLKSLGASANELLSDMKFTSLTIEVVYVTGFKPTDAALNNLAQFLSKHTFKPDGIKISTRAVASSNKAPFSIEEIAELEAEERTVYNAGDEIAVFIYVADGSNENDEDNKVVVGSAFRNTSMVLYGKTIANIANNANSVSRSDVESAVLKHEFGHLFGLVDVGSPMQVDHLDPENLAHCNVNGCLMTSNIEFGSSIIDMVDNKILELDDLCINDLVANGGR
ncbi:hypothetical protein BC962_2149 [Gillisia mitskevichiae]|uniref:Membrane metalloprotease n=1 Tax=Gillisia mitskevichiae TaxID=270921 RepID=A0A495PTF2_9FLAO|nr:hypothetical protein [Gillisia mitskevichiae]RKS53884.1 hypothetical protein BC962_2149 [Gillisia mitskevichiae]